MGFLNDLRQRRIVQIFITFLAGSWIALEVVDQLVGNEVLPAIMYQLALVAFIAGIPAALVIGWFHGERGNQKSTPLERTLLGVIAVGGLAAGWIVFDREREEQRFAEASQLASNRIAIMYFDADENARSLADGFSEALIEQFEAVPSLEVISRNGVAQFQDSDIPADSVARVLDVGALIEGDVTLTGNRVRATIRLVDGGSGTDFRRETFEFAADSALQAPRTLAAGISELLREWLGQEIQLRERRAGTSSVAAWLLVQQAERERERALEAIDHHDSERGWELLLLADSLAGEAARADSTWVEPLLQQAWVDYRFGRLHDAQPLEADTYHRAALAHLDRARRLDDRNAAALSLSARIKYVRWLLGVELDHTAADRLLASAEEDATAATRIDRNYAPAWDLLSHLAYQRDDIAQANLNARNAYDADAYLDQADIVIWRLFHTSYDLENFTQARRWCDVGVERFPADPAFKECQLWLMTAEAMDPEPDRAWELAEAIEDAAPEELREFQKLNADLLVAGVLVRAGAIDSARAVVERSGGNPRIDPLRELLLRQAFVYTLMGDNPGALSSLEGYLTANPDRVEGFREHGHWWWRGLRQDAGFRRLVGG